MKVVDERKAAAAAGLKIFDSTVPCRVAGHVGKRYTVNGGCLSCLDDMKVQTPPALGVRKPSRPIAQRLELNLYLPTIAWREVWTQQHTNQATQRCQAALDALCKEWVAAMPAQPGDNPNK